MRISGGVLAIMVALSGAGCAPGPSQAPAPESDDLRATTRPESTGPGGRRVTPSQAAREQARRLTERLDRYLRKRPGRASVAVYDRVTGMRYHYREHPPFRLADVAKIDILLVLLLRGQERMHGLTPAERRLATRMIRFGDDRAAQRLYTVIGGRPGLSRTLRQLGIEHTRPGPGRHWETTRSVASDQLRVLDVLTTPDGPVNDRNRAFAATLLSSVAHRQHWGIGAAAARRDRVALKNGWQRARVHGGRWTVNSAGRIISPSRDTLITVLSERNPKRRAGRATVEHIATMVMDAVRRD